jgi:hypothetical protein
MELNQMKKTLLALALTVASSSSFANEMFNFEGAQKSATAGYASVGDYTGVKFGGRLDLTSGLYADISYFTVSADEVYADYSFEIDFSQLKAIAGMHFPSSEQSYWLVEGGFAHKSIEVGNFDDSETDLAYKLGAGWDFGNKLSVEGYLASEGGDSFIGGFAKYEVNEKFDVTVEYNLDDDAHMFIMAAYKF